MTPGQIGWLILGYFIVGFVVDRVTTIVTIFIIAKRNSKRNTQITDEMGHITKDMIEDTGEKASMIFPSENDNTSRFKALALGLALWPITIPVGLREMVNRYSK